MKRASKKETRKRMNKMTRAKHSSSRIQRQWTSLYRNSSRNETRTNNKASRAVWPTGKTSRVVPVI
jgi:hypothetical protein